mgnify:CR=1 FL=1
MQENEKQEYAFIREKIKDKPFQKRKLALHVLLAIVIAVVFGVVACATFTFLQPKMQKWMYPEEDPKITIPRDEEETETEEKKEEDTQEEAGQEGDTEQTVAPETPQELTLEDYQKLQNQMYAVGRTANNYIVTVTGVKSDTDWFHNSYESKGQGSGIIIGNNGRELLILTEKKVISDAQDIFVTFVNDVSASAAIKKYDGNTGITVLSVLLSDLGEETLGKISIATLGNSKVINQGTLVMAVGSPTGANYSILTGTVTSTSNTITTIDSTYTVFTTDIVGSSSGSGALINLDGEVIGLVMQGYSSSEDENTLTAVSISELKSVIEMLSNNQDIPYLGLQVTTVTQLIQDEYDIPKGVYIKDVMMDSPAMAAGLQSGDVIVEVNGETITSAKMYENTILSLTPGDTVKMVINREGNNKYHEVTCNVEVGVLQ